METDYSDWQTAIGGYFAKNNLFRLKYLNEQLNLWCAEFIRYLNDFNGVSSTVKQEILPWNTQVNNLEVAIRTDNRQYKPFVMTCRFNSEGRLVIKSSIDYSYDKELEALMFPVKEKYNYLIFKEEEFSEPEIAEKEYVLGLFNSRLIRYIEALKKSQFNS